MVNAHHGGSTDAGHIISRTTWHTCVQVTRGITTRRKFKHISIITGNLYDSTSTLFSLKHLKVIFASQVAHFQVVCCVIYPVPLLWMEMNESATAWKLNPSNLGTKDYTTVWARQYIGHIHYICLSRIENSENTLNTGWGFMRYIRIIPLFLNCRYRNTWTW